MRSWLPADHEVWFVIDLVERLDLSALVKSYRLGAQGRAPVSPTMLLTLLVWAYSRGVRSSRRIERACREDVAFRVICANEAPDHSTIARFRQRHEKVAAELFTQVLAMCDGAGLVNLGVVAVDGTKMSANAAKGTTRNVERLRVRVAEMFAEAEAADASEDAEHGDSSGSGLPADLVDPVKRAERIAALLADFDAQGSTAERVNTTDPESQMMHTADGGTVQGYNAQVVCGAGHVVLAVGVSNEHNDMNQLVPMLDHLAENLAGAGIQADLGTVLADAGYFSAANLTEVNRRRLDALIATKKSHEIPESGSTHDPIAEAAALVAFEEEQARIDAVVDTERHRRAAILERIDRDGLKMTDHLDELGMCLAVANDNRRRWRMGGADAVSFRRPRSRVPRPVGRSAAQIARDDMNNRFAVPENRELYKQRSHLVETYFGHNKGNRRIREFMRRGLDAVNAEWALIGTAHNIGRLYHQTR